MFARWDPLDPEQTEWGMAELRDWKRLLAPERGVLEAAARPDAKSMPMFDLLLWDCWMPPVRRAALRWDPRSNSPQMIVLLISWLPLLPGWLRDNLFDQVILPRIGARVEQWDPVTDEVPLDEWLVPWHEILGDRLLDVFQLVRQKLGFALKKWQPTDLT